MGLRASYSIFSCIARNRTIWAHVTLRHESWVCVLLPWLCRDTGFLLAVEHVLRQQQRGPWPPDPSSSFLYLTRLFWNQILTYKENPILFTCLIWLWYYNQNLISSGNYTYHPISWYMACSFHPHSVVNISYLVLSSHLCLVLLNGFFPTCIFLLSSFMRVTCPTHLIYVDFIILPMLGEPS
jgi:hypothetical protein